MTWTLWRGDSLLGVVHERSVPASLHRSGHGQREVNGVLVPDPAQLPLPSVVQHVMRWPSGRTVMERFREPHVTGDRLLDASPSGAKVGVWVVPPGPASAPAGVPPDRQLQVRDTNGRVVPTRSVRILEHRPDPAHLPSELATFAHGAFVDGSVWLVFFTEE